MSKGKHEKGAGSSSSEPRGSITNQENWDTLPDELGNEFAKYLPLNELAELAARKLTHRFFQPILDEAKRAHPLLKAVVEANPEELVRLVSANPELLFQKGQVKDPAGQRFYNVSPYQLMTFLGDARMKQEIMFLVLPMTEAMEKIRLAQYEEIESGGPDLVKMAVDPTQLTFDEVLHHTETYRPLGQQIQATFPLLENPDGLIYYKEPGDAGAVHFYYANQDTQTVEEVKLPLDRTPERAALDALIVSMDRMENNSSRRSSNEEHRLIASTLRDPNTNQPLTLHRKGIQYDDCEGVRYCDYRIDFNRYYNTNRQCIRLYNEEKWDEGDRAWLELGKRQRELMWRLQFLCQENLPFYPTPNFSDLPNRREFKFYNLNTNKDELVFGAGGLTGDLGSEFTLYKGLWPSRAAPRAQAVRWWPRGACASALDLVAVCRLVEGEKSAVNEFKPEQDSPQNAGLNP